VREAGPADWDEVGELTVAAYVAGGLVPAGDPYIEQLRRTADRARAASVLVAVGDDGTAAGGALMGAVTYCRRDSPYSELARAGESEFRMLAVAPEFWGRGVGAALVRACIERACDASDAAVVLSTLDVSAPAHRLYGRLGFAPTPDRDWEPEPGLWLRAYRLDL